jgi:hypothetical protein
MKVSWMAVMALSVVVAVGCGDRTPENTQNLDQNAPGTTAEPAAQPAPGAPAEPSETGATAHHQDDSTVVRRDARPQSVPPAASRPAAQATRPAAAAGDSAAPASKPAAPAAARWREVTLPAGTALPLELMTALSSETAKVETPVRARVRQAVEVEGFVAIPAGTVLTGSVIDVARPGRVQGRSRLAIRFTEAEVDGTSEEIRTNPIAFEGEQTKGEDATKIGAGAVGGAIIGGILGGGDGAAKGAAIGGAAGTGAVLATRGREVTLAAGTDLPATLASPVTIRANAR